MADLSDCRLGYGQGHGQAENSLPKQKEGKSLDELFQRTKCQPFVYFKPLTDEEVSHLSCYLAIFLKYICVGLKDVYQHLKS